MEQDEEFFKWFQIAHDFHINRKQTNPTKEQIMKLLPPKQPTLKNKKQDNSIITEIKEKNSGSHTARSNHTSKTRISRNVLQKNQS